MGNKSSSLQLAQTEQQQKPTTDNVFLLHSNHYNAKQRLYSRSQSLPTNSLRVLSYQYNTWTDEGIPIHPEEFQNRRHSAVSYIPHRNRVIPIDLRPNALSQSSSSSSPNSPRSGASSAKSASYSNISPRYSPRKSQRSNSYSTPKQSQQTNSDSSSPRPYYNSIEEAEEEAVNLTAFRLTSSKYNDEDDCNIINTQSFINPLNHHQFHTHVNTQPSSTLNNNTTSTLSNITLPPLEKPNLRAHPKRIIVTPLTQLYTRTSSGTTTNSGTSLSNSSTSILGTTGSSSNLNGVIGLTSPFKLSSPSPVPPVSTSNSNAQPQIRRYSLSGYTMKRKSSISSPTTVPNSKLEEYASTTTSSIDPSVNSSSSPTSNNMIASAITVQPTNPSSITSNRNNENVNNQTYPLDTPTPPLTPKSLKSRERSGSVTKILIQSPSRLNPMALFSDSHKRKQPPTVALTTPDEPPCFDHLLNPPQESLPKKLKTKRNRSYSLPSNSPKSPSKSNRKNKRF
ncbi:predicted protein [Naegleria gruberi]|uniref:Predicted protein n=1 Tax=Naegleria gruberi TaxID=5762 RepID=D2VZ99_NAEGR|nr:uncharacterized protein NAEGRDRAFT_74416 [Naegleria gruberi]EFC37808.1 predicted protein [Naegleria gruberi]|eukprot:XP_002670552.1 predicted protein [Naegleria gruberi strain NEG-M]